MKYFEHIIPADGSVMREGYWHNDNLNDFTMSLWGLEQEEGSKESIVISVEKTDLGLTDRLSKVKLLTGQLREMVEPSFFNKLDVINKMVDDIAHRHGLEKEV
jgi:hypothetical protein